MAYAAGLSPEDYNSSCLADVVMTIQGHQERETYALRNTRILVGVIHASLGGKENVLDLMPLPGDPTKEERMKAKAEEYQEKRRQLDEFTKKMKAKGLL